MNLFPYPLFSLQYRVLQAIQTEPATLPELARTIKASTAETETVCEQLLADGHLQIDGKRYRLPYTLTASERIRDVLSEHGFVSLDDIAITTGITKQRAGSLLKSMMNTGLVKRQVGKNKIFWCIAAEKIPRQRQVER